MRDDKESYDWWELLKGLIGDGVVLKSAIGDKEDFKVNTKFQVIQVDWLQQYRKRAT